MLAIPNYDEHLFKTIDDVYDILVTIQDLPVDIMNDFDVPWISI